MRSCKENVNGHGNKTDNRAKNRPENGNAEKTRITAYMKISKIDTARNESTITGNKSYIFQFCSMVY